MNKISSIQIVSLATCLASFASFAGPVTTVAWNGYTGAASFTYDDARTSQIPNLFPQLNSLNLKATFFLANMYDFPSKKSDWIAAAKAGRELGNHTSDHSSPTSSNVQSMATTLRGLDPVVDAVTFAYPNCTVTGTNYVSAENFMARGCGNASYAWGSQPSDWMNIQGLILGPTSVSSAITLLNTAQSGNKWVTTIVHDVTSNPDTYSMTPADNLKMLNQAVTNKLWIGTFQDVGAYYRAHFTMDAVTATKNGTSWDMKWTSPHPKMPKSVKLRVKLDATTFGTGFVVTQSNVAIAPESDGSYVIDFMKLAMSVSPKSTAVQPRSWQLPSNFALRLTEQGIAVAGFDHDVDVRVTDLRGATLFQGRSSNGLIPVAKNQRGGVLLVSLIDPVSGVSAQRTLNTIR